MFVRLKHLIRETPSKIITVLSEVLGRVKSISFKGSLLAESLELHIEFEKALYEGVVELELKISFLKLYYSYLKS